MDLLVGIDLGSTHIKAVARDARGRAVASASRPTERAHPDPDHPKWTVWPPERIWGATAESLREAVASLPDPSAIRAVAVTGMGMDGLPVDRAGEPLYPFISWLDPRTAPQREWWLERVGAERQFSIGGNQLWPINSALRIRWMLENEPELMERADRWLLIEDFVNFKLSGERATDHSMASNTLLFDQRSRAWSEELLEVSGIDRSLLCDPRPSGTLLGEVTSEAAEATGLARGTPVVLGGHDYLCGALAVGASSPGTVLDVTGTWEIVVAALERPALEPAALERGLVVESHVARDTWSAMGAAVASDALEWFCREHGLRRQAPQPGGAAEDSAGGEIDWPRVIAEAGEAPPGAGGVLFLPHLAGSTCPIVDPRSMGSFVGLRSHIRRGHLVRAVFEGLDYQLRDMLEGLESALSRRTERVVAIGGATRNELWMQSKADVSGHPIEVPEVEEATSLGAALLAGIGVGMWSDEAEAQAAVRREVRVWEPDPELAELHAARFERYRRLCPALAGIHAEIFDETP